ncbi:MAG TPA: hypothetical protein VGE04_00280 [Chloroflexia bacterium]
MASGLRRVLPVAVTALVTMVLTSVFQPLSQLETLAQPQSQQAPVCQTIGPFGKAVCGKFLVYWHKHGGLSQFGYPISGTFTEVSELDGQPYTMQYFERAIFELHPKNNPPYDVLLSQLGTLKFAQKYRTGEPGNVSDPALEIRQPELGLKKELRPGIVANLKNGEQAAITGISQQNCGLEMTWVLQIQNTTSTPFVSEVDVAHVAMFDSTGKSYPLRYACAGGATSGSFAVPMTLGRNETHVGTISFQLEDIPRDARYFELRVNISKTPITFRYMLQ